MTVHEWFAALYGAHPEHAALIVVDLFLAVVISAVLVWNYRRTKVGFTALLLVVVALIIVAELLDVAEHFIGIHPARMVPMTAALAILLYLLWK